MKTASERFKTIPRFVKGDLANSGKLVVLVTGYGNNSVGIKCFAGVVIIPNEEWPIGMYSRTWDREAFKKCEAKIQLLF